MGHGEYPVDRFNVKLIELKNHTETDFTPSLSGALFLSGGALIFKGAAGTVTVIGAA